MKARRKETELTDSEYADFLDEIYGDVQICGMTFGSGQALQELDPIAFRCGKSEYESELDSESPTWVCSECEAEYDGEDDANDCCQPEGVNL